MRWRRRKWRTSKIHVHVDEEDGRILGKEEEEVG